jgi:hypothetical protein
MRDPDVAVDRRRTNEWMVMRGVEQQYPVSFRVHNIVRDIITIEFDLTWRGGVIEGSNDAPHAVSMRYQKTFGSDFIMTLSGSMVARPLDADTTEVELVRHIKSTGAGAPEAELYLRDVYASLAARVQGRPLPRYN